MIGRDDRDSKDTAILADIAAEYNRWASELRRVTERRAVQEAVAAKPLEEMWAKCAKDFLRAHEAALEKGFGIRRVGNDDDGEWIVALHVNGGPGYPDYPLWFGPLGTTWDAIDRLRFDQEGKLVIDVPPTRMATS